MNHLVSSALVVSSLATAASAAPRFQLDPRVDPADPPAASVCTGPIRCQAHVRATSAGELQPFATATGYTPADLWSAYHIDPKITNQPTIAIVDAFGYANLETDLAVYRATFGLPPCTRANGCLTIVNQNGQTSPLPADPPSTDDWTLETALDVDTVSAACPLCRIVVVQADADTGSGLFVAQTTAIAQGATVISNSWGYIESAITNLSAADAYFTHAGVATFASSGDLGYDYGGKGPLYPSTSNQVIGVGGTRLVAGTNGWLETAWTSAGSSCSATFAKPAFQGNTGCANRAASDISAVADPATGLAIYNSKDGGWLVVGGTSAASPLVASIFAMTGHGDATPDQIPQALGALRDVTSGGNGGCNTVLCNAAPGWDGPTGYGTPDASKLVGSFGGGGGGGGLTVAIASPHDGATVSPGFEVDATSTNATSVALLVDGTLVGIETSEPFAFVAPPAVPQGAHLLQVVAYGANGEQSTAQVHVTVAGSPLVPPGPNADNSATGGCSAGGGEASLLVTGLALALLIGARRRRPRSVLVRAPYGGKAIASTRLLVPCAFSAPIAR